MTSQRMKDIFIIVSTVILMGIIFLMPTTIPLHFNIEGEIDGYGSRYVLLLLALLPILIYYGMLLDKHLDPKKVKDKEHQHIYDQLRFGMALFFIVLDVYLYVAIFYPAIIKTISITILIGVLMIYLGIYMPALPQNYTIGIKTTWALDSEEVWKKTHKIAGLCFIGAGMIAFVSAFMGLVISLIVSIVAILLACVISVIYSYVVYHKTRKDLID